MILEVTKIVEIEADTLLIQFPFEDRRDPDDPCPLPEQFLQNGMWAIGIDLDTRRVKDWPQGTTATLYEKVCDRGRYALLCGSQEIAVIEDYYVPDCVPNEYGDYIALLIEGDGSVSNAKRCFYSETIASAFFDYPPAD